MTTKLEISTLQAGLAEAGFLRGRQPPFNGQWDTVTQHGYEEFCRQNNQDQRLPAQPNTLDDVPPALRLIIERQAEPAVVVTADPERATVSLVQGEESSGVIATISGGVVAKAPVGQGSMPPGVKNGRVDNVLRYKGIPTEVGTFQVLIEVETDNGGIQVPVVFVVTELVAPTTAPASE